MTTVVVLQVRRLRESPVSLSSNEISSAARYNLSYRVPRTLSKPPSRQEERNTQRDVHLLSDNNCKSYRRGMEFSPATNISPPFPRNYFVSPVSLTPFLSPRSSSTGCKMEKLSHQGITPAAFEWYYFFPPQRFPWQVPLWLLVGILNALSDLSRGGYHFFLHEIYVHRENVCSLFDKGDQLFVKEYCYL